MFCLNTVDKFMTMLSLAFFYLSQIKYCMWNIKSTKRTVFVAFF